MRLDSLTVQNFRGLEERTFSFHPEFNLVVGENGRGKTTVLDAAAVALGSWFLGLRGYDTRHIRNEDVRLVAFESEDGIHWEMQFPCHVRARGVVSNRELSWSRSLNSEQGRTTYADARAIKDLAAEADENVRRGEAVTLPIISYYGTGRLWNVPRADARIHGASQLKKRPSLSRLEAYRTSVDPRLSVADLVEWIARESWAAFQKAGEYSPTFRTSRTAMLETLGGARDIYFDAQYGEVITLFESGERQPFNNLSDGQRCMLALVGDLARKAAILNPHMGENALRDTPGVVLVDELDLHLHPRWQRRVIEDLRRVFPSVQFICTTHSPFLIQSLRSGEELLMLEGQPTANVADMPLEDIAKGIQGVDVTSVSARYAEMRGVAKQYLATLDEAAGSPEEQLEAYKKRLADSIAPYADNPAFQAFLEMKRAAKLGE